MPILKFPLTFDQSGAAEVIVDGDTAQYDQVIALTMRTLPGEHPLEPAYGTIDPTFESGEPQGFRQSVNSFWPEIIITSIDRKRPDSYGMDRINVSYEL
jgi:hypothetical protein